MKKLLKAIGNIGRIKEFDTGTKEAKDESLAGLSVSGNNIATVGNKFHGYDHDDKSVNY